MSKEESVFLAYVKDWDMRRETTTLVSMFDSRRKGVRLANLLRNNGYIVKVNFSCLYITRNELNVKL